MNKSNPNVIRIEQVLDEETRKLNLTGQKSALCISGGGIRSATFGLGVLQGLARYRLLQQFDYLSTVSGGGYIGSWLSAWVYRHPSGIEGVCEELHPKPKASTTPEPPPVSWLRSYSNYLSPKLGCLSADSWTLVGTYLRNLLLNWLVFIPLLLAILAIPRLGVSLVHHAMPSAGAQSLVLWAGVVCAMISLVYVHLYRPGTRAFRIHEGGTPKAWQHFESQPWFLACSLLPLLIATTCFTVAWAWYSNQDTQLFEQYGPDLPHGLKTLMGYGLPGKTLFLLGGAILHAVSWTMAFVLLGRFRKDLRNGSIELAIAIVTGAIGGYLLWKCMDLFLLQPPVSSYPEWYATLAGPIVLGAFLLAATLYIGLSSRFTDDQDREWWGRSGSWTLLVTGAWVTISALVTLAPSGLAALYANEHQHFVEFMGGTAGILSALTAVLLGASPATAATPETGTAQLSPAKNLASTLAASIFILLFLLFLAVLTSRAIEWLAQELGFTIASNQVVLYLSADPWHHLNVIHNTPITLVALFVAGMGAVGCIWSLFININKFSLHSVYRNRLIRAYLGASRQKGYKDGSRSPNRFTGFDPADNIQMSLLAEKGSSKSPLRKPFHIVNIALNLVSTERLDWQQRKAQSFTVSGLHCGSWNLGYRKSEAYGRNNHVGRSISLGTALAISGAAASPNMGYHSSPAVTFLLTLFNVRLGWWLGNPGPAGDTKTLPLLRRATYQTAYPGFSAYPLLSEAFGQTDAESPYVYLSDGGHFENLGLYEMVLRRCRYILVSDAGCDEKMEFQDLGNAIRKIRIDLGIDIDINVDPLRPSNQHRSRMHYAIGTIRYSRIDPGAPDGILVYLKLSLSDDEPVDVLEYAAHHKQFPHEPTSDQFFDESQFESYRRLGEHVAGEVFASVTAKTATLPGVFDALHKQHNPSRG